MKRELEGMTALAPSVEVVPVKDGLRPRVQGKFLFVGREKLYVRGTTYGAFCPDAQGNEYHDLDMVERDFAQMAANGLNAVRIPHTMPPRALLDAAQRHGLRVMVGLSAEQYVGFLTDTRDAPDIEELVRAKVRTCAGHPALLCYGLGNEIPARTARWLGRRRVERYLARLYRAVKAEDPDGLVTYVNYPSTEYLQLPFLDLVSFNVYLESQERLQAYLARLQNIAGDRPLIMSEIGLDSLRNGEEGQARVLDWQVRTTFAAGCAGGFVFAWTDDWCRGTEPVDDWAFGLTHRDRYPKPALASVRTAFAEAPFPPNLPWPRISVIVCSHNGARTIRDCLEGLGRLTYPDFEVILVDDGSADATAAIAAEYDCRLIRTENRGLSSARNTGLAVATGEIVAYIDDDAYPDPHWLTYLAATFLSTTHAGVGGPNIAPPGDGPVAACIDNAPGNPTHILLSDWEAEHIPGCNMAFRKASLQAIGGFDPQFRVAGDDVDVCWRLQEWGGTLGFSPAAMVWHHRRDSLRTYWNQQRGYGKAEALLERKWPAKYNTAGHLRWSGRVYSKGLAHLPGRASRIYHGMWGRAPFQFLYEPAPDRLQLLALVPEWYLVLAVLAVLTGLGTLWPRLLFVLPLLIAALGVLVLQAVLGGTRTSFSCASRSGIARLWLRALTTFLYLHQPLARLLGRLRYGVTPWRSRGAAGFAFPRRLFRIWSEQWQIPEQRIEALVTALRAHPALVFPGGEYDRWDLEVRPGMMGSVRILMDVEDHPEGCQLIRVRVWPRWTPGWLMLTLLCSVLAGGAALDYAWGACAILGIVAVALALRAFREAAAAMAAVRCSLDQLGLGGS